MPVPVTVSCGLSLSLWWSVKSEIALIVDMSKPASASDSVVWTVTVTVVECKV